MSNNDGVNLQVMKNKNKSSRAIKLACHQDLSKARFESNFGPEATGHLQINLYIYKNTCKVGSVPAC